MLVGVPREVKNHEYRVAITPAGVQELTGRGHQVLLERGAGAGAGFPDEAFVAAGARISADPDEVWGAAGLVLKVKEPVPQEYHRLRSDQVLFTFLHLAASKECTDALVTAGARGVLLGGVSGVPAGKIAVIGAGVSGMNAATIALGLQAEVMVLDTNLNRLRQIDFTYRGHLQTITSNAYEVERACLWADLVIGAVLVPGAKAPTIVSTELVSRKRKGSVLVDISIDQGGCFADSRPTTHDAPVFRVHESVFYCVANMPGAVPNTSTRALTNVTLPYAVALADRGFVDAVRSDPMLARGVNVLGG